MRSNHKVSLTTEEQENFQYFIHKLSHIKGYGSDILEKVAYLELMVFLNKRFHKNRIADTNKEISSNAQVDSILSYINQHITAKRISHAKELLAEGYTVSETSVKCGFNDYSNFLRHVPKLRKYLRKKYAQFLAQ